MLREIVKSNGPLRRLYYRAKMARSRGGQSDEASILRRLAAETDAPPRFVEIGFHPAEFNCAALLFNDGWTGTLIDGDAQQVDDALALLPPRAAAWCRFLTLDGLDFLKTGSPLGVLSIDVDGNDYWFMKSLLDTSPSIVCVEYNSSFGGESVTVPYRADFDRHLAHPSGWYHGASLGALANLAATHGYGLAAVSEGGANAFFTRTGRLDPGDAFRPNAAREGWSGASQAQQWDVVKDMPFIHV